MGQNVPFYFTNKLAYANYKHMEAFVNWLKIATSDLISIGVLTAIYFVLVTIATFGSALLIPGFSNIFLPAIVALISVSVYMLMVDKL